MQSLKDSVLSGWRRVVCVGFCTGSQRRAQQVAGLPALCPGPETRMKFPRFLKAVTWLDILLASAMVEKHC